MGTNISPPLHILLIGANIILTTPHEHTGFSDSRCMFTEEIPGARLVEERMQGYENTT